MRGRRWQTKSDGGGDWNLHFYIALFSILSLTELIRFTKVTAIAEMIRGVDVDTSYQSPNAKGTRACVSIASNIYTALFSPLETPFVFSCNQSI